MHTRKREMSNGLDKKMLETGEMLNTLNVLNAWGQIGPKRAKNLTYLTFPLFRAFFAKNI